MSMLHTLYITSLTRYQPSPQLQLPTHNHLRWSLRTISGTVQGRTTSRLHLPTSRLHLPTSRLHPRLLHHQYAGVYHRPRRTFHSVVTPPRARRHPRLQGTRTPLRSYVLLGRRRGNPPSPLMCPRPSLNVPLPMHFLIKCMI